MNLPLLLAIATGIVAFFWAFRSTPKQGQRILARWHVPGATVEQGRLVADYLRARRNLYPYVLLAVIVAGGVLGLIVTFPSANWLGYLLATVLATLLITDLVASWRQRAERTRVARSVRDLVPWYGLAVLGAQVAVGLAVLVASITIQATDLGPIWASFAALVFAGVAAVLLVRIARDRGPLTTDHEVDTALRLRSARVGVASAAFMAGGLLWTMLNQHDIAPWLSVLAPVAGFLTWGLLVTPWRTSSPAEADR